MTVTDTDVPVPYPSAIPVDQTTISRNRVTEPCAVLLRRGIQMCVDAETRTGDRFAKRMRLAEEAINRLHHGFCGVEEATADVRRLLYQSEMPGDLEHEALTILRAVALLLEACAG